MTEFMCTLYILCKNCMKVQAEKVIMFQNKSSITCKKNFQYLQDPHKCKSSSIWNFL